MRLVGGQLLEQAVFRRDPRQRAVGRAQAEAAPALVEPGREQFAARQRQPARCTELPGRTRVIAGLGRQRHQALALQPPRLPEAGAIAQADQPALGVETGLLQGFVVALAREGPFVEHAALGRVAPQLEARGGPGLMRMLPFDPGQLPAVGAQHRRGVEIGALGQQLARAVVQADRDQPMRVALLLDGEDPPARVTQRAVAQAFRRERLGRGQAAGREAVDALVALVDERHLLAGQAERAAAVFVDAAARAEAVGADGLDHAVARAPDPAHRVGRVVLGPEHAGRAGLQFDEVAAGGHGLVGGEARPRRVMA